MLQPITSPICTPPPSQELLQAVEQFNSGDWFECHETLEDLWVGSTGELRDFYQGVLMIAVALHHWREGNFKGSVLLLNKGADHLRRVSLVCQRVEVASLLSAANRFRESLDSLGPERMAQLDPRLVPQLTIAPE
jgi:predicted metal-dependent hydrolase